MQQRVWMLRAHGRCGGVWGAGAVAVSQGCWPGAAG